MKEVRQQEYIVYSSVYKLIKILGKQTYMWQKDVVAWIQEKKEAQEGSEGWITKKDKDTFLGDE